MDRTRYQFIAHALDGTGPFRPQVLRDSTGSALSVVGLTALVPYPRESDLKFARRNEVAWYVSDLKRACSDFVGYFSGRSPMRDLPHELYQAIADDIDGKGNAIDVFWSEFMVQAKARGAMCLLVDMPPAMAPNLAIQMESRVAPYVTPIKPESITDYQIGDDGKFEFAEFSGKYTKEDGQQVDCTWHFDREMWEARDKENRLIDAGMHPLGECPVLIFSESGDFPSFGPFSEIAEVSKRLFNAESELDEILRAQTFSLLTMQVPEGTANEEKIEVAKTVGQTIGTSNLMVHTGQQPAFIAPPDGPARIYMDRVTALRERIKEIALDVRGSNSQESGIALQMRFRALNSALSSFAARMEDLERRMWELARLWLGLTISPDIQWPRDFNLSDIESEMMALEKMQATGMPDTVIAEQQKRIVSIQFAGLDPEDQARMNEEIEQRIKQRPPADNVIPLPRPDPNDEVRGAIVRALNA